MADSDNDNPCFGSVLASLRKAGDLSQLSLALTAEISTRHLSFLETGRSAPTRQMVLRLATALGLNRADKDLLMRAAGFWEGPVRSPAVRMDMPTHGPQDLDTIIAIETAADPRQATVIAAERLASIGLRQFYTGQIWCDANGRIRMITPQHLDHAPLGWLLHYRDRGYRPFDPLVREAATGNRPFFWNDVLSPAQARIGATRRILGDAREFRIGNGFVMPIYRPDGSVHALSAMAETIDSADPATRAVAKSVSVALLHRLHELGLPEAEAPLRLEPRERDLLLYVLEGRSARTAAMTRREADAQDHRALARICARFGTSEPLEAALRARRAGALRD